jgi:four helix bundle protein
VLFAIWDLLFSTRPPFMAKYERFEDLPVWQEAARLYNRVLDLFEQFGSLFSAGYRNQMDRAALSVSNNVAEGFERVTTAELLSFLSFARGSAGEVRSMIAVVRARPALKPAARMLAEVRSLAESCARQIKGWMSSIEESPVKGKRHLNSEKREAKRVETAAVEFRLQFLRSLSPSHPLYNTPESRAARGETA